MSIKIFNYLKKRCENYMKSDKNKNKYVLGSVIFKGGKILGEGINVYNRTSFLKCNNFPAIHAEMSSIMNYCNKMKVKFNFNYFNKNKHLMKKLKLMVIRVSNDGEAVLSKPCKMCLNIIKYFGIKKIFYINEYGDLIKILNCEIKNNLDKTSKGMDVLVDLNIKKWWII